MTKGLERVLLWICQSSSAIFKGGKLAEDNDKVNKTRRWKMLSKELDNVSFFFFF